MSQGSRAVAPTIVPDPGRSGNPFSQEEIAAWQDQTLHSWHTGWCSPQRHQQPFPHVPLDPATEDLAWSLLLPGESSCCFGAAVMYTSR